MTCVMTAQTDRTSYSSIVAQQLTVLAKNVAMPSLNSFVVIILNMIFGETNINLKLVKCCKLKAFDMRRVHSSMPFNYIACQITVACGK